MKHKSKNSIKHPLLKLIAACLTPFACLIFEWGEYKKKKRETNLEAKRISKTTAINFAAGQDGQAPAGLYQEIRHLFIVD